MRNLKRIIASSGALTVAALTLASCFAQSPAGANTDPNKDPRKDWVLVTVKGQYFSRTMGADVTKRCDGTTLMYISDGDRQGGISVIPDSPECK